MKNLFKLSAVLVVAALAFSSCNCFKKMAKNRDELKLVCVPEVMTLNNGVVAEDITVTFPEKYFNKKAVVKVTPYIVYEGGEVAGKPQYFQGSKVKENYTVVDNKMGGSYTMHVEFPYTEAMRKSELQIRAEVKCPQCVCEKLTIINLNTGKMPSKAEMAVLENQPNSAEAAAIRKACGYTIAKGVNTLQQDLNYADAMNDMANNYKKVTTEVSKADLVYKINDSKVAKKALDSKDIKAFKENVEAQKANDRATQNIYVNGYASPDGPEKFNDKLSKARSDSGKAALAKLIKDSGLDIDAAAYGEDWAGFKEAVQNSNIKDKEMILQVLSLYESPVQRESEIKNMSTVFGELKTDVLPQLRRAQLVNSTDLQGKTDAEMTVLVNSKNFADMNVEELLYYAENVAKDDATKVSVLEYAASKYNDARAYNNLGVVYGQIGDAKKSLAAFEKAAKLGASSQELNNNLALANLANGNVAEAKKYAAAADEQTKSLLAAAQGDYNAAAKQAEGYNAAVANVMSNNYAAAKKAIANDASAKADYLRAVIASKEGDLKSAEAQLKSAIAKDKSLAQKAASDVNLQNLFNGGFKL